MLPTKSMRPYYALSDIFVRAAIDADATSRVSMPVHTSVKDACRVSRDVAGPHNASRMRYAAVRLWVARKIAYRSARPRFPAVAANGVTSGSVSI